MASPEGEFVGGWSELKRGTEMNVPGIIGTSQLRVYCLVADVLADKGYEKFFPFKFASAGDRDKGVYSATLMYTDPNFPEVFLAFAHWGDREYSRIVMAEQPLRRPFAPGEDLDSLRMAELRGALGVLVGGYIAGWVLLEALGDWDRYTVPPRDL